MIHKMNKKKGFYRSMIRNGKEKRSRFVTDLIILGPNLELQLF